MTFRSLEIFLTQCYAIEEKKCVVKTSLANLLEYFKDWLAVAGWLAEAGRD